MQDSKEEAIRGDKAAQDLMLGELLQVCTKEDWKVSGASIYALDKLNGNNLFYASIRKESKHCSAYEVLANAKLIALAPTIAAELIKERAVNAKLLEALKSCFDYPSETFDINAEANFSMTVSGFHLHQVADAIKQAEEL